jgi:hypothetical protein
VHSLIFGHKWNGYDLIAADPFRMLITAYKMQSETIYQEAMKHAIGVHLAEKIMPRAGYSFTFLADAGYPDLFDRLKQHYREHEENLKLLERRLLNVEPECCGKIGVARNIGTSIYRDWIIARIFGHGGTLHWGIVALAQKDWEVNSLISNSRDRKWTEDVNAKWGHIHRGVESCFNQARGWVLDSFDGAGDPKGEQIVEGGCDRYYTNISFETDYEYPWAKQAQVPSFMAPVLVPKVVYGDAEDAENEWQT